MLKCVGSSGQLTLGKRFAGRYFEIDERSNGELVLRPVKVVPAAAATAAAETAPEYAIAQVDRIDLPTRDLRHARS